MKYIYNRFPITVLEVDPMENPHHAPKPQPEPSPQSHSPVAFFGILQSQLLELLIHLFVEVISEEEGPEAEESVHLLRLANAQAFPLWLRRKEERCVLEPGCLCFRGQMVLGLKDIGLFSSQLPSSSPAPLSVWGSVYWGLTTLRQALLLGTGPEHPQK